MSRSKLEMKLQSELKNSAAKMDEHIFYYKIADAPIYSQSKTRFTPEKPFDIIMAGLGKFCAIETKVHKKNTAWSLSTVSPNQVKQLKSARAAGFHADILVNVRYGLGKQRVNFISIIPIEDFLNYQKNAKRKSILVADLEKRKKIEWVKNGDSFIWNLYQYLV